ncbi:hypothetical protein DFS34DRAFT_617177 [Phlyctochytrium arcticum]|nr:hypothetical protein DFS34DRAFT_617177 [Phlyctochytrium arcticum]
MSAYPTNNAYAAGTANPAAQVKSHIPGTVEHDVTHPHSTGLTGTGHTGTGLTGNHHTTTGTTTANPVGQVKSHIPGTTEHNLTHPNTGLTGTHHTTGTGLTGTHHNNTGLTGTHHTTTGATANPVGQVKSHIPGTTEHDITHNNHLAATGGLNGSGFATTGAHAHNTGLTGNNHHNTGLTGNNHHNTGLTGNTHHNTTANPVGQAKSHIPGTTEHNITHPNTTHHTTTATHGGLAGSAHNSAHVGSAHNSNSSLNHPEKASGMHATTQKVVGSLQETIGKVTKNPATIAKGQEKKLDGMAEAEQARINKDLKHH